MIREILLILMGLNVVGLLYFIWSYFHVNEAVDRQEATLRLHEDRIETLYIKTANTLEILRNLEAKVDRVIQKPNNKPNKKENKQR